MSLDAFFFKDSKAFSYLYCVTLVRGIILFILDTFTMWFEIWLDEIGVFCRLVLCLHPKILRRLHASLLECQKSRDVIVLFHFYLLDSSKLIKRSSATLTFPSMYSRNRLSLYSFQPGMYYFL